MYFKQKSNILFRNYKSFGYITDNRNFRYKQINDDKNDIGDKIVSQSGAVFLSVLERKPILLDELAEKISSQFTNIEIETIKDDAEEFYSLLESEGFIVSGETYQECNEKDFKFSYKYIESKEDRLSIKIRAKSTKEFFDDYFNDEPHLTNLHIEITSKCNERCIHCYIPHNNKLSHINSELFYNILDQCKEMNILHITLSGGEPMMHPDFVGFLKKCNEYNFSVNVLSNLTYLNEEIIEEMKRNQLLSIQVSLYSVDSVIHDEITQTKGSFEKTQIAILKLLENNIPMQISCPIIKQNIDCYSDVINWGREHNINVGIDYDILAEYTNTTQNLSSRLSIEEIRKVIEQRIINEPQYLQQMEDKLENKKSIDLDDIVCSICYTSICVSDNGTVYPCAGWQGHIVGNLNEKSLRDIWNSSVEVSYLRNLRKRDFPKCTSCPENEICNMCMVKNANEHPSGDPLAVNEYFCDIVKLQKKIILEQKCNPITYNKS